MKEAAHETEGGKKTWKKTKTKSLEQRIFPSSSELEQRFWGGREETSGIDISLVPFNRRSFIELCDCYQLGIKLTARQEILS